VLSSSCTPPPRCFFSFVFADSVFLLTLSSLSFLLFCEIVPLGFMLSFFVRHVFILCSSLIPQSLQIQTSDLIRSFATSPGRASPPPDLFSPFPPVLLLSFLLVVQVKIHPSSVHLAVPSVRSDTFRFLPHARLFHLQCNDFRPPVSYGGCTVPLLDSPSPPRPPAYKM